MAYSKYYSDGWKDNEEGGTPITAAALNNMENGIKHCDEQLTENLTKGTPALTHYLQAYGSSAYKALVSDVAKCIINDYKGLSLAGTAQSVKSALDSLNSDKLNSADGLTNKANTATTIPDNADLNTYTTVGEYRALASASASTLSNCPYTGSGFKMYVMQTSSAQQYVQLIIGYRGIYVRTGQGSSVTWYNWTKLYDYAS